MSFWSLLSSRPTRWLCLGLGLVALQACAPIPSAQGTRSREMLEAGPVRIDVVAEGQGPTVILLPSSQRDSLEESFDEVAARIAAGGFRVLRPQPRGYGRSSGPMEGLTLSILAQDVVAVIDRLGGGKAILVGHAYGHFIARVVDLEHPGQVRGVVVAGAAAKTFPNGMVQALTLAATPEKPRDERIKALQFSMFAPGTDPTPWLDGWYPHLRDIYRKAGAVPDKDRWWLHSHSPILDLQGDEDPWRPLSTRNELKDVLGNKVTVQVIPRAGHAMFPEQPHAVADAIVAWSRQLPP